MKLSNLLIIGTLILPLSVPSAQAETIIIKTGNGTKVQTNSDGGVNISTPKQKIHSSGDSRVEIKDDDYSSSSSSSSGQTCYQENTQTSKVNGSSRTIVRSTSTNCY